MKVLYNNETNQFQVILEGEVERVIAHRDVANLLTELATEFGRVSNVIEASTIPHPTVVERQG